jgi:hypothetical protein
VPASEAPALRSLLALVALAAAVQVQAQANFREAYARGKEAAANSRWSEVEARMREAIAAEPNPQARVRIYGMRFEPYVPQYFLGLAAYRQGNCAEAQRQWTHAATAAILGGDPTLKGVVEQGLADCAKRQPQLAQQPAQQPVQPPVRQPAAPGPAAPAPATTSPAAPPPAQPATRPGVAQQPVTQQPVTQQPVTQQPVTQQSRPPTPAPAQATTAPAASSAPPALVAALDAWIAGRIEPSANLDLAPFTDNRARFHALLVRSAARHALSQAGGERGEALLAAAQADIRAARALAPTQAPDPALFSPRYRRLFDATR